MRVLGSLLLISVPIYVYAYFRAKNIQDSWNSRRAQSRWFERRKVTSTLQMCDDECDVAIIGAGIGGLSAAAILSEKYGLDVRVFEAHYHAGGCAHAFPIKAKGPGGATYQFDAGPTIVLGCSRRPYNPLRQVLNFVGAGDAIDWIRYDSWGMWTPESGPWSFQLGEQKFEEGPLRKFGGEKAVREFQALRSACAPLCAGSASIPTVALRGDKYRLLPLLGSLDALQKVIPYSDVLDGSFEPLMEAHVTDPWLKAWLDALAFSLSGLPAAQTGAAALAYTLFDLHRHDASLDYPRGGMGKITEALVDVLEQSGGRLHLRSPVESVVVEGGRAVGVRLQPPPRPGGIQPTTTTGGGDLGGGHLVRARRGVICNANVWALPKLLRSAQQQGQLNPEQEDVLCQQSGAKEMTKSFLHLHLGINATGIIDDADKRKRLHAHYTIMDKGIFAAGVDPCEDRNMVAVSNPSILDDSLVDQAGKLMIHAYGAGNEPYDTWSHYHEEEGEDDEIEGDEDASTKDKRSRPRRTYSSNAGYKNKKKEAAGYLYRSIATALNISEAELREREEVSLIGTPLTHARYLRRDRGTYGSAWGAMLDGPETPLPGLLLAGDSVFPGIGVPAVAVSGASAANTMVNVVQHMYELLKGGPLL